MKKLLILGAGYTQIPLIQAARDLGYKTAVASIPGDYPAFACADECVYVDISDPQAVVQKAREIKADGAATCGLDLAMRSIGAVCEELHLCGPSRAAAQKAGNKYLMKTALKAAGVQTADFRRVRSEDELTAVVKDLGFPVVIKAVDLMGSRGIYRCESLKEAKDNYKKTMSETRLDYCLVEEFIEGTLFGTEGMVQNGEICFLLPNNTESFGTLLQSPIGHSVPFEKEAELGKQVREQVTKAIKALGLDNCPVNVDLIQRGDRVYIVELTGRSGATGLSEMVGTWYGINYYRTIARLAMGETIAEDFASAAFTPNLSRTLLSSRSGRLVCLEDRNPGDEDILELSFNVKPGDEIRAYTNGRDRIGQVMIKGESLPALKHKLEGILDNIYMELEGDLALPETPVQKISSQNGNDFYIKREDLLPFSFGGNKVRFARCFLEDMERTGTDAMIIYGNYHSNLCRILSAACASREIPCSMVHNVDDADPDEITSNSYLIKAMNVKEYPCHKGEIASAVAAARKDFISQGCRPYYIYGNDLGEGNAHVPMEAYVKVYREIKRQEKDLGIIFDPVFLASSTNTTQSGLLAGMLLEGDNREIIGISVSRNASRAREVIEKNLRGYMNHIKKEYSEEEWNVIRNKILVTDEYLLGGYGKYSETLRELIRSVYREEGLYLDETYTGKAFFGMREYLKKQKITGKQALFLHTGGGPLFFDSLAAVFENKD